MSTSKGTDLFEFDLFEFWRVRRGDKFYEAHRSHAYQYASRLFGAHAPVSLAFGVINLFWLLPVAVLVTLG